MKSCKDKPGVNVFDSRLLKLVVYEIAPESTQIIILGFTCSKWPQAWKQAKIITLLRNCFSNSGPIGLPLLGKISETIVYEQLKSYLFTNNIISFRHAYKGTLHGSTYMSGSYFKNMVGVVFLDFLGAFSITDHHYYHKNTEIYIFWGFFSSFL